MIRQLDNLGALFNEAEIAAYGDLATKALLRWLSLHWLVVQRNVAPSV